MPSTERPRSARLLAALPLSAALPAALALTLLAGGACSEPRPPRPNVLLIVIDTLRADHMSSYGYRWDTAPEIERRLARRGVVAERAYAQAPWTLPSTASLVTGGMPVEVLGADVESFVIAERFPTLSEALREEGYETATFIANPLLHEDNGFARGAGEFFTPPLTWDSLDWVDATTINERAIPWLRERAGGEAPFFLYLHYIDPHDPYVNPTVEGGRTPWDPDYDGAFDGDELQELYAGERRLDDREADLRHLVALYDSEIRYVDAAVGELLGSLPEEVLRDTLVVLTSDHGEEFLDHGGWKHGQTLYEEMLRVPLIFRWDRWLPAGERLEGTVRLLDVYPTVLSAVRGEVPGRLPGVDLLPALRGDEPLPELAAFAQHLTHGPDRAAVVRRGTKLVLFNENVPFDPPNRLHRHLWGLDTARMERVELYDLAGDPGERRNLAPERPDAVRQLARGVWEGYDRSLAGLRIVARGLPRGAVLTGTVRLDAAPERWRPVMLAEGDRVEVAGDLVRFELRGDGVPKGAVLDGGFGAVAGVEVELAGADAAVVLGEREGRPGEPVPVEGLEDGPRRFDSPTLHLWWSEAPGAGEVGEATREENRRRLEALGYVG